MTPTPTDPPADEREALAERLYLIIGEEGHSSWGTCPAALKMHWRDAADDVIAAGFRRDDGWIACSELPSTGFYRTWFRRTTAVSGEFHCVIGFLGGDGFVYEVCDGATMKRHWAGEFSHHRPLPPPPKETQ